MYRKVLFVLAATLGVCAAGTTWAQVQKPAFRTINPGPSQSRFTQSVSCPDHVSVDVTPPFVPPGWVSMGMGPNLSGAYLSEWQGQQMLLCAYGANGVQVAGLRYYAPLDSCIKDPTRPAFLCKPGVVH